MGKSYQLIIIGSGPAGITAAIYAIRKGLTTLLIGKEVGGQVLKTGEIENYPGLLRATGFDLGQSFKKHLEQYPDIAKITNKAVKKIKKNKKGFTVEIEDGEVFNAPLVIIASGRNPRKLNVPGEIEFRNKGLAYCEICDAPLFRNKTVAVVGSGNSGLETALTLAKICPKVYVIEFFDKIGGDQILQNKITQANNIEIITKAKTLEILGDKFVSGLKYLNLKNKKEEILKIEGVFIQIGWEPAVEFDTLTKKNKRNEIMINCQCETSVPGIFAAGDCTNSGFYQIIVAAGEGAKAALSAFNFINK